LNAYKIHSAISSLFPKELSQQINENAIVPYLENAIFKESLEKELLDNTYSVKIRKIKI
jgi:hypothetical protein